MPRNYYCEDCGVNDQERTLRKVERLDICLCGTCYHKDLESYHEEGEEYALYPVVFGSERVEQVASQIWQREHFMLIQPEMRERLNLNGSLNDEPVLNAFFISQFLFEKLMDINPFSVEEVDGSYVYYHTERVPVWTTGDIRSVAYNILSASNLGL